MRINWLVRVGLVFAGIVLIFLYKYFHVSEILTLENLKIQQDYLLGKYNNDPILFLSLFLVVYIAFVAISLPGAVIFTVAAGAIFGVFWGTVIISISSTIGATLAFGIARYLLSDFLHKKFSESFKKIDEGFRREGLFYLFTLRLVPIAPFFLVNLIMGLTPIRVLPYFIVSLLGMLPGTALYVNAGTQLAELKTIKDIFSPGIILSFAVLGIMPLFSHWIVQLFQQRRYLRKFKKPKQFDYNVVVIGGGSAGLSSAYIASTLKAKVALVEKHKMGGDCLNTGCVPSKAIIRTAEILHNMHSADRWGIEKFFPKIDFPQIMSKVQEAVQTIAPKDSIDRYTNLGVDCFSSEAKILSPYEVELKGKVLRTKNIIIATGAAPVIPEIQDLKIVPHYTSDTIWQLQKLPKTILILGGGPIGCEFAQTFARMGSKVNLVDRGDRILPREDAWVSEIIKKKFEEENISIYTKTTVGKFEKRNEVFIAEAKQNEKKLELECDCVLLALGRKANTKNFGLENLEIDLTANSTIAVNEHLQTLKYPNIFACGDVSGPYQFTHTASYQASIAVVNTLFRPWVNWAAKYEGIPWCTFTHPEVARVGKNAQELTAQGIPHKTTQFPIHELDRAIAEKETIGSIEVITEPSSDTILGVTIVSAHAGEMIAEFVLAMKCKVGLNKILETIHIYPTWTEANKSTAGLWKKAKTSPKIFTVLEAFHRWRR